MNPSADGPWFRLGKVCRSEGRWAEAEAALREALKLAPQNAWARLELGTLYLDQDRLAGAAAEITKALVIDPGNGGAHCQLGRIYHRQGRRPEAEAALRKALELDPQNGGGRMELGVLYEEQERFPEATAEFEKAVAIGPKHAGVYCNLGRIYRRQGRLPRAEAALKEALAISLSNDSAWVELGALYKDQGRFGEAEAACRKAITLAPRNGAAHFELGNIYRRQGRWREAEAEFKEAISNEPENDRVYVGLWAIYRSQGLTAEAEAAARKAAAMNPNNAWVCARPPERLDLDNTAGGGSVLDQVFCLLPWTHLHIRPDGASLPCCVWGGPPLGNARISALDELWNSPSMRALRLDMMSGRPVAGCWRCYDSERSGWWSPRQANNICLGRHHGRERLTAPDGALPRLSVPLLDIRFSNACNLRCRTCDTTQSSAWTGDARALGFSVEGGPVQKSYGDWDSLWRQLQPLLEDGPEEILFAGGEPLIMEEHYRILDFLISRKLWDVRLRYNTNLSNLRFQGRDVIDLWSRFHDVRVSASLDGSGRRGEYLRKGLHWDAVVANREEMSRRCPDVAFSISATLSIFNALHLPDFHREWVEKGYANRDAFALNMLVSPEMYRMQVLLPALKERVLESYRRHREAFLDADGVAARDFAAAARSLLAQDYSELLPGFVAMTRRLDGLRGEDCREVFPELAELFEAA